MSIKTINNHCVAIYNHANGGITVFSYDTPVLRIDNNGSLHRLWSGWSATTQRDINTACNVGMTKKLWESMPVEY